ncbi:hypothetical protein HNQ94_003880 [Salirhabdus euzebyi]|uniref:YtxH domain-containing protein n=1 Tax=Salirhabdus euzebyi TaxID=394506 RepID=A0A841QAE1_9BACI|nr:YtxH domain-containing protein [Salirhabdus euzebyi]MBB6455380.1 hypothetical protein [Salirhabdus euzebyi]
MKKYSWKRRVIIGASIGALCALLNKETRNGAKQWAETVMSEMREYRQHPSKAVHDLRLTVQKLDYYADSLVEQLNKADELVQNRQHDKYID